MTPEQITRLVIEWHRNNGNDTDGTIAHYAITYALTPAEVQRVRAIVAAALEAA